MNNFIKELAQQIVELSGKLENTTEEYTARVSEVEAVRATMAEASTDLADVTNELVYEASIEAKLAKSGPLFGIAVSDSKGMNAARAHICKGNASCRNLAVEVAKLDQQLIAAESARNQAEARMKSMRTRLDAMSRTIAALGNLS